MAFVLTAQAQNGDSEASSGSVYSRIGIGLPVDEGGSGAKGMGMLGVSYIEPFAPGFANPAHWGSTIYGMGSGSIGIQHLNASDYQSSASNTLLKANFFQLQLPILRNRIGISASITPLTRSAFSQVEVDEQIIGSGGSLDTLLYQSENFGSGGLNRFELGAGFRVNSWLSVGYAASLVHASIDNNYSTIFGNTGYNPVQYTHRTSGTGIGNRFGLQFDFPSYRAESGRLSLGFAFMLPVTIEANRVERAEKSLPGGSQTVITEEGDQLGDGTIRYPATVNAGISYQVTPALGLTAEGLYQNWSDFIYDFSPAEEQMASDRYQMGLGLRFFPYISGRQDFLSRFKYRLGATYDTGHLKIHGRQIETVMFSFGIGLISPSPNAFSSIDISFEYGFRGTNGQNLVKEDIWGLRLTLNLAEYMFYRRKLQ